MLVRLSTGFLAVFSPPPLTAGVREVIEAFGNGEVAYLICPNAEHYIFLHDWYSVFPKATVMAPQTLVTKFASGQASVPHVPITLAFPYQQHSPDMKQFEHEFEPAFFGANANEIALLHRASRTLLTADMVFNPPATESYTKSDDSATKGLLTYLFNWSKGTSGFPLTMQHRILNIIAGKGNDRNGFAESARGVTGWDFERIVCCHGEVVEKGAKGFWEKVYERILSEGGKSV
ncbi:hypothetical protein B0A49_05769 [Cryomyces minteri]|uniref:DUF4336 domain-containing protein n=1 Tax=Cryomyces minteri TaxID=331657 RepID=A0A4U0XCP2_9PEZI|nr:hypothetical protein B0A49_05769 [Cryomyces minteri]